MFSSHPHVKIGSNKILLGAVVWWTPFCPGGLNVLLRSMMLKPGISKRMQLYLLQTSRQATSALRNNYSVQYRKWCPTANDPETANDPQNGPQMILDRKWSPKLTANDPVETWGMEWILWDWLQKRTDYKKGTFFSRLLNKEGRRTLRLRSIYTRPKKSRINLKRIWYQPYTSSFVNCFNFL